MAAVMTAIRPTLLTITFSLTACLGPVIPYVDDDTMGADELADTTGDTTETESDETSTTESTDSESTSEATTEDSTEESEDSSDESDETGVPSDMPSEELGCCVCLTATLEPSCIFPAVAAECESLGLMVAMTPTWVPCFIDSFGVLVCEIDCPNW